MNVSAVSTGPTVLEHPRFRVFPRKSNQLAIFFSGSSTPDHEFRWWKIANRISASAILVNNGPNEWYQRGIDGLGGSVDEVASTFRAWADHLDATRIYTIGTSMGGAGALIYGAKLDAKTLAFAAETRTDFPWGNVQRLMDKTFVPPHGELRSMIAQSKGCVDLICGESEPVDLLSASLIGDLPQVNVISLKKVAHGPPNYLKNRGRLDGVLDAFLSDRPLPPFPEQGDGAEGGYPAALYDAYCADKEKRFGDAEQAARQALAIYPNAELATALLGRALLYQGRALEAVPILREAMTLHPTSENRFLLATAMEKSGDVVGAVAIHKEILKRYPTFSRSHYALGKIYAAKKSWRSALKRLRMAIDCDPGRANFKRELDRVSHLAGFES